MKTNTRREFGPYGLARLFLPSAMKSSMAAVRAYGTPHLSYSDSINLCDFDFVRICMFMLSANCAAQIFNSEWIHGRGIVWILCTCVWDFVFFYWSGVWLNAYHYEIIIIIIFNFTSHSLAQHVERLEWLRSPAEVCVCVYFY